MRRNLNIKQRKWRSFIFATIFGVTAATAVITVKPLESYAYTETAGVLNDGPVQMRKTPVDGDKITSLAAGTAVRVIDEVDGSDGMKWYKVQISYNGMASTGYIRSDFITLSTEDTSSGSAITDSSAQGAVGVVTNTNGNVYVRTGASTAYSPVTMVKRDQTVNVLGQTTTNGTIWYNVTFNKDGVDYAGWICGTYLAVTGQTSADGSQGAATTVTDEEYVASLKSAGFPDSYCNSLLALHQKYPDWQFVPVQTGQDWNTVIANESVVGRNLVQSSSNDARKSTETGAYDWATNKWYGYDGAGWVSASSNYIAYCMDPRNYLNDTYIFQFETLEYAPYQNVTGVGNILSGSFMSGNYSDTDGASRSYADTFMEVGQNLSVSPYHLAARCKQEQGNKGTSPLISGNYSGYNGYYNYFNIGAYTTSSASATVNGLIYAKNNDWNSIYKSLNGGAGIVGNNYVKKGQNTLYFQKFNVVNMNSIYSHQYMTNVQAAMSEGKTMSTAYADKSQGFIFRIPVYSNMPESAVTFSDSGNPNNWLSSLSVSGYGLTPSFQAAVTDYSVIVGTEVSSINVGASAVAPKAGVSGAGTYALNYGNNVINVTCVSQSGSAKTYTINVVRQQPAADNTQTPESGGTTVADGVSVSTSYKLGDTVITGITPGTGASSVLANISAGSGTVKVLKADGTENTGAVGTGNKIAVYANGTLVKQYDVVIYGDINGDGKISVVDLVMMQKQILGTSQLSGAYAAAADISRDGKVSVKDLVLLQKHIINAAQIEQ